MKITKEDPMSKPAPKKTPLKPCANCAASAHPGKVLLSWIDGKKYRCPTYRPFSPSQSPAQAALLVEAEKALEKMRKELKIALGYIDYIARHGRTAQGGEDRYNRVDFEDYAKNLAQEVK